nr:MAG TPA: hypothetical protein [Crassvirales sp.]
MRHNSPAIICYNNYQPYKNKNSYYLLQQYEFVIINRIYFY